jgi:hypothetical protein
VGCGGYANGAHVHFSVYHFATSGIRNVFQTRSSDMNGDVIGNWVVHDGARSGLGYMQRLSDGAVVYPSDTSGTGAIYNDGTAGGAKPAAPTGYVTLAAVNVRSGPGVSDGVVGSLANGAPVSIACQTRGDSVNGSSIWDGLSGGGYVSDYYVNTPNVGAFSPGFAQCAAPTPPTTTTTSTQPPASVNRQAITSYNRMTSGAPYHGQFIYAWQPFTAQSNTITSLGATVGNAGYPAGQAIGFNVSIRLCTNQPDSNGNCSLIGQTSPQVINYGDSQGDIGDVAVTPGTTYWIEYFPPQAYGNGWVTYWWAGGSSINQSDQMQAIVQGYNR